VVIPALLITDSSSRTFRMIRYGTDLKEAADSFNIDLVLKLLKRFTAIVQEIRSDNKQRARNSSIDKK
jgi:hypothetical protein